MEKFDLKYLNPLKIYLIEIAPASTQNPETLLTLNAGFQSGFVFIAQYDSFLVSTFFLF